MELTQARLKEVLHYDPKTGLFAWLVTNSNRAKAGSPAGSFDGRYLIIRIDKRRYYAHRLAFLYMTGAFPRGRGDHRDLNKLNNRWENLRDATVSQNSINTPTRCDNALGLKGVYQQGSRFVSTIYIHGVKTNLGSFGSADEAHKAYVSAANDNYGVFARAA